MSSSMHQQVRNQARYATLPCPALPCASSSGLSRDALVAMAVKGAIERVAPGVYIGCEVEKHPLIDAAAWTHRYPAFVTCLLSAAEFHNLTDAFPRGLWMSILKGSSVPRSTQFLLHPIQVAPKWMDPSIEENGIDSLLVHDVKIHITNPHRTVLDMWRLPQKISAEYALLALRALVQRSDFHVPTFARMARRLRIWSKVEPVLKGALLP